MEQQRLQADLLDWYDRHGRTLPWRVKNGLGDPYRVWLSEIMLQQTTVATVGPYFENFTHRWPTLEALAKADLDSILHAWQGLGYYARARNLHKCAGVVARDYGGRFPDDEKELLKLPGIGAYTAAAIAAIAFGKRSAPVDGNIVRVISRLMKLETPLPQLRGEISEVFRPLVPGDRPGDFVQAIMDLGSNVCTPRKPLCDQCPWCEACAAYEAGVAGDLPKKAPKKAKPTRHGVVFWTQNADGHVLLRRRTEEGLLGGMMEFPSTAWREKPWRQDEAIKEAPLKANWKALQGAVRHTFTHFHLELTVLSGRATPKQKQSTIWSAPERLTDYALPSVMKKVASHVSHGEM